MLAEAYKVGFCVTFHRIGDTNIQKELYLIISFPNEKTFLAINDDGCNDLDVPVYEWAGRWIPADVQNKNVNGRAHIHFVSPSSYSLSMQLRSDVRKLRV